MTDFDVPDELNGSNALDGSNALVAMNIDVEKFWDLTLGTYTRVAASMSGG